MASSQAEDSAAIKRGNFPNSIREFLAREKRHKYGPPTLETLSASGSMWKPEIVHLLKTVVKYRRAGIHPCVEKYFEEAWDSICEDREL